MKKLMIVLITVALLLTGCGQTGVSQEEYDKVVAERDKYKEQLEELMQNLGEKETGSE